MDQQNEGVENISRSIFDFNMKILKEQYRNDNNRENICASYTLIYYALVGIHIGAKGKTAEELRNGLGVDFSSILNDSSKSIEASMVHHISQIRNVSDLSFFILHKNSLKKKYKQKMIDLFCACCEKINDGDCQKICDKINEFVKVQTNGLISNLIDPEHISPLTSVIITNTIFFKASWDTRFDIKSTQKKTFHLNESENIKVDMMHSKERLYFINDTTLNAKILIKPFSKEYAQGIFILPNEKFKIKDVIEKMACQDLSKTFQSYHEVSVDCYIPKFNISQQFLCNGFLQNIGIGTMFTDNCDISGIIDDGHVSTIIHSAKVQVDEEGAIAAAATCVCINQRSMPLNDIVFVADHPFIFIIYDTSLKYPLFMNVISNPNI